MPQARFGFAPVQIYSCFSQVNLLRLAVVAVAFPLNLAFSPREREQGAWRYRLKKSSAPGTRTPRPSPAKDASAGVGILEAEIKFRPFKAEGMRSESLAVAVLFT